MSELAVLALVAGAGLLAFVAMLVLWSKQRACPVDFTTSTMN